MTPETFIAPDGRVQTLIHLIFRQHQALVLRGKPLEGVNIQEEPWRLACHPTAPLNRSGAPYIRSEEPRAITCPECKQTEVYARAMAERGLA